MEEDSFSYNNLFNEILEDFNSKNLPPGWFRRYTTLSRFRDRMISDFQAMFPEYVVDRDEHSKRSFYITNKK